MDFKTGDPVRINTPGESHHNRTGTIVRKAGNGRLTVDLGDVIWWYWPAEVVAASA